MSTNSRHYGGSSGSGSPSSSRSPSARRARAPSRKKLRNGTWIVPATGERTRRQFSLRDPNLSRRNSEEDGGVRPFSDAESTAEILQIAWYNVRIYLSLIWAWIRSPKGKGVIKCSIAYLLASMGTFWHTAALFLGPQDGKHIVATITVYFHPARSAGSQLEAVAIACIGVCYAMVIGVLSMEVSVGIGSKLDMPYTSYAVILVVFIGGGLGFIGWVKQKLNSPLVSVGASIASIGIITIVTKENSVHTGVFSNHKIIQSLKILLMATVISTVVNLTIWPISARHQLRQSMRKASTTLGEMLSMVGHGFLGGREEDFNSKGFTSASAEYNSTLAQMNKSAREAKAEYYILGREQIYRHDRAVVKAMENLAQSLGGLRSAANTQFELLKEVGEDSRPAANAGIPTPSSPKGAKPPITRTFSSSFRHAMKFGSLASIVEAPEERSDREDEPTPIGEAVPNLASPSLTATLKTPGDIFDLFILRLGPSLKSLVHTMAEILNEPPFDAPGSPVEVREQFKGSLSDAIVLFNNARREALEELYKTIEMDRARPETLQADFEEVAAACGHFSFSLLSFADEMHSYLEALDDLKFTVDLNRRSWRWMMFWKKINFRSPKPKNDDPETATLIQPIRRMRQSKLPAGIPSTMAKRRDTFAWNAATPADGLWSRIVREASQKALSVARFLSRDDIRFGLKVGIGATIYAMFAFIPATRPIYRTWRGEWGLLSFMIVCSMTVGASNATGASRFFGTIVGAIFVLINWFITDGEPISLAILGCLVSFGGFYIIVDRGNGPFGRFILLSYNVSSLYAYSLSQRVDDDDDDEGGINPIITDIAMHRVIAVFAGVCWGLIVCRLIWPMSARRKFKEGLSVLYLQMGLIWRRGPLAILLQNESTPSASYMRTGEQAAMQRYASQLRTLCSAAQNEFELRGPFPTESYNRIMASTQRLLDAFRAMSLVTEKHGKLSPGEKALLYHTADERAQLCNRICHVFQVLASGIILEYPLNDAIPSVIGTRDKLLGKIFRFRKEHNDGWAGNAAPGADAAQLKDGSHAADDGKNHRNGADETSGLASSRNKDVPLSPKSGPIQSNTGMLGAMGQVPKLGDIVLLEGDYALLYAYALVTGQVAKELKQVELEIEGLFGRLDEHALLLQ